MSIICPECKRLELAYEASIEEIYAVLNGSFETVGEKLNRLSEKQSSRDKALLAFYEHKAFHIRRAE